jgi:hypothetical protein
MKHTRANLIIPIWWLIQLCVLLALGIRHLGHLFVVVLLIVSLVGHMFGGRKVSIASSFGLASYSALTLIGAILLCYMTFFLASNHTEWLLPIIAMAVAIINIIISFKIIRERRDKKGEL